MSLPLSAEPVREFYGAVTEKMPILVSGREDGVPREIMPIAFLYYQRVNGQEPFRTNFRDNYFWTAAAAARDKAGNQKLVLRAQLLREVNPGSKLSIGALVIPDEGYEALSGEGIKEITKDEVANLNGKGYVRKEGRDLFVPANDEVQAVHEFLSEGRINLAEYAGTVAEETSRKYGKTNQVITLYFDQENYGYAVARSLVVNGTDDGSDVFGNGLLLGNYARLAGVAPEALDAFDNVGGKVPTTPELATRILSYLGNVREGLTRKGLEDAIRRQTLK